MILAPLLVAAGGALGAVLRYAVGELAGSDPFPVSTLVVNVVGSFLLGALTFGDVRPSLLTFLGVGFCGAFTTFSSFSYETVRLYERGHRRRAAINAVGNLAGAMVGIAIAWTITTGLGG